MTASTAPLCWVCRQRPAETAEHRFKASDVRIKAGRVSRTQPVYLQRGDATNIPVGSDRSKSLKYPKSLCGHCNSTLTQPYDYAWETLCDYLQAHWPLIRRRGRFDLSKPFRGATRAATLDVHLFFVKLFGCKLHEEGTNRLNLDSLGDALVNRSAHPEITITIAESRVAAGVMLMWDSEVHTMSNQRGELHGATWMYLVHPVAVKVNYIKTGAPLHVIGHAWHPDRPTKFVKLSPYVSGTEPIGGNAWRMN